MTQEMIDFKIQSIQMIENLMRKEIHTLIGSLVGADVSTLQTVETELNQLQFVQERF